MIVQGATYSPLFEPFDRPEYDNNRLREAKNTCGAGRLVGRTATDTPYLMTFDCGDPQTVPLWPNNSTTTASAKQKFKIKRYNFTGALSAEVDVDALYALAESHQVLLARFEFYKAKVNSDIDYTTLFALRSETFSYLTATGITIAGTSIDATETDMLITSFTAEVLLSIPTSTPGVSELWKSFSLQIEHRDIFSLGA